MAGRGEEEVGTRVVCIDMCVWCDCGGNTGTQRETLLKRGEKRGTAARLLGLGNWAKEADQGT